MDRLGREARSTDGSGGVLRRLRAALATPAGLLRAAAVVALAVLLVVLMLSGGDGSSPSADPPEEAAAANAPAREPGVPPAVSEVVGEMDTDQKLAQLMLVGLEGFGTGDPVLDSLEERQYGGVVVSARNFFSEGQVAALADAASDAADDVEPWVMAPQEGGEFNAFEGLPPDKAPAEVGSPGEAADLAEEAADALRDLGFNGILAPVIDVGPSGEGGALGERVYSDDEDRVASYAKATVDAYADADIFAAAKHFPGLGSASQPTEIGPANVGLTLDQLEQRDLKPFEAAIRAGVPGIVVGHGLYGVDDFITPASMSETLVTGVLREDLGFDGLAIADDLTAPAITSSFRTTAAAVDAIAAGIDMVYVSQDDEMQGDVFDALSRAVRSGLISEARLNEAVTRVLEAKREAGVYELEEESEGGGGEGGRSKGLGATTGADDSREPESAAGRRPN